jgi:hypothetical protein
MFSLERQALERETTSVVQETRFYVERIVDSEGDS